MLRTVRHIVTTRHDAEDAAQAIVTKRIGIVRFLPCRADGGEHLFGLMIVNR